MIPSKFVRYHLFFVPGAMIPFKAAFKFFLATLSDEDKATWNAQRFSQELSSAGIVTGFGAANKTFLINCSLDPTDQPSTMLSIIDGRRIRKLA